MKKILTFVVINIFMLTMAVPSFAQLIDWNRKNKNQPKPVVTTSQYQGTIISKKSRSKEIVVKNFESGEEKMFIIGDENLFYSLLEEDEVQINFQSGSNVAQSVTVLAKK